MNENLPMIPSMTGCNVWVESGAVIDPAVEGVYTYRSADFANNTPHLTGPAGLVVATINSASCDGSNSNGRNHSIPETSNAPFMYSTDRT